MENVCAIFPYVCSFSSFLSPPRVMERFLVDFGGNGSVWKVRINSEYLYIWLPNSQDIRICIHAEQYSTLRPPRHNPSVSIYDLNTLSSSTVTDELLTKICPGVTVLSFHWSGTQQTSPYPKTQYHVTDHVVDERAISIFLFLNLAAWRAARWYIGQVNSSQQDWLMALRKNIRSYICTGSDPGPTISAAWVCVCCRNIGDSTCEQRRRLVDGNVLSCW